MGSASSEFDKFKDSAIEWCVDYIPKIIGAIIVSLIGCCIIGCILKCLRKLFVRKNWDPTLTSFLITLFGVFLKIILFLIVLNILGLNMSLFAAIFVGFGLALAFAL